MNALDYFLKANLYGLLFAGCYWLFLRRHTFLTVNRAYLLLSAVLSLTLPLASLPAETAVVPMGVLTLPILVMATAPVEPAGPDWTLLSAWAYGLIAFGLLLRLAIQTSRLIRLIRQSERQVRDGYLLVLPHDQTTPTFSFFWYVVLNPADVHNDLILNHELVHVRQHHSADVLGSAVLRAVFWPVLALAFVERALRHVHEFLADNQASHQPDYAHFLVEYTFGVRPAVLTNGFFNPSLLKQRILMLHQRATNRWALGKYALVLPLAFGLLAMTTAREEITAVLTQTTDEMITVSGQVKAADGKPLPGATVVIKDTKTGTATDVEGRFTLSNVPRNASLAISFIGFTTQVVPVKGRKTIDIVMTSSLILNEVVVTAYESSRRTTPLDSTKTSPDIKSEVYTVVEQVPEFPGGMSALGQYLSRNLRYPARAQQANVKGRVFVQFVVTETGAIQDLRILKGIGFGCDEEAVRVVSQMPKWRPGKQYGKPVEVMYNLPIQFSLEKNEDKRTGQVEPAFAPTNSPIGDFPTTRSKDFPNQPRLNTVTIRGAGPLGRSGIPPLYIIDGVESLPDSLGSLENIIDPNTIQSITVLKDASARAYGEKGKNGVVIITTKKP